MRRRHHALAGTVPFFAVLATTAAVGAPSETLTPPGVIAFERHTRQGASVWVTSANGHRQRQVKTPGDAFDPAWRPTGRIAFISTHSNAFALYDSQLNSINAILRSKDHLAKAKPAWSPNGRLVAFEAGPTGQKDIYVMPASGGRPTPVTRGGGDDVYPTWSPNSKELAFSSNLSGHYRLYRLRLGSGPEALTAGPGEEDLEPRWAPDGTQIAFTRQDKRGNYDVWTITLATERQRRLTHGPAQDFEPTWSPDSKYIAFVSNRNARRELEDYDIFVMTRNGGRQTDITHNPAPEISPAWAPRGVKLFGSNSTAPRQISLTCDDGTEGPDVLIGTSSDEQICGKGGNDLIKGGGGNDEIYGEAGKDRIYGEGGNDVIYGGDGSDRLFGGSGDDEIYGGDGRDKEIGGDGVDSLWSRDSHVDVIRGGPGAPGAALDRSVLSDPDDDISGIP